MKKNKLVLTGLLLCIAIIISACGSSNKNNLEIDDAKIVNNENETSVSELNIDTIEKQEETDSNFNTKITQNETAEEKINLNEINEKETSTDKILIAYFSATGTTKKVAEKIAELTGGDLYEIIPANPYSSADLNWHDNNSRTTKEMNDESVRPEIGSDDIDISQYKTIYLGYPIWWGDAPRIMSTFVEKYNFDGKKVIPFCTSGGSGIGRSGSNLFNIAGSGNFASGERLNSSADTNNIQNFINNNK